MTEAERIIKKGVISPDFLKEETRCDFFVDSKRKKTWALQLDMLLEVDRVCKKHGLKYFLGFGSLLGAIRHEGFIPWDDDIDIIMLRSDYDRLMEIGNSEFEHPYFLQTPYTDPGCYLSWCRIRNSNASSISKAWCWCNYNFGMALDIFPLDNCVLEGAQERYDKLKSLMIDASSYQRTLNPNPSVEDQERIKSYSGRDPMELYEEMVSIATQYKGIETDHVSCALCTVYSCERMIFPRSAFDDVIYKDFEGISFPIPKQYDEVLRISYGDYMEFPPVEKRGTWHTKAVVDPDIPYKELIKTMRSS